MNRKAAEQAVEDAVKFAEESELPDEDHYTKMFLLNQKVGIFIKRYKNK